MVDWRLWRDTLFLRTPGANRIRKPTDPGFRTCTSLGKGRLSLTATLTVQSNGLQFAVLTVVSPTLTTLVMISFASDGSGVTDDDGVPNEFTKDVTATTLVTVVAPAVVSDVISKDSGSQKNSFGNPHTGKRGREFWERLSFSKNCAIDKHAYETCRVEPEPKDDTCK